MESQTPTQDLFTGCILRVILCLLALIGFIILGLGIVIGIVIAGGL